MRRRVLLSLAAGSLAGLAGCNGAGEGSPATEPPDTPTRTTEPTERPPTDSPTEQPTPEGTPTATADPNPDLAVDLERVNYVVETRAVPEGVGIDPDEIVPAGEVPPVLRRALREAVDGAFVTDAVSEDLLAAIEAFRPRPWRDLRPYVHLDGTAYEFDPTVPTFVAHLAEEPAEEYDPERVANYEDDFESEVVEEFVRTLIASGTHVARDEYRTMVVPVAVEAFLERYDYLEDQRGVARIETERVNAEPPYTIELRELTEADMWGRPVLDGAALDPDLRSFLTTAVASDHRAPATMPNRTVYFADAVPEGLLELRDRADDPFVRLDGTVYGIYPAEATEELPVEVALAERPPDEESGRAFSLTIEASAAGIAAAVREDSPVTLTARGALPSVLWVVHDGERRLLASDAYDRERWREAPDDPTIERRPVNEVLESLQFGEAAAATYRVPGDLPDGTYVSRGTFGASWRVPDRRQGEHGFFPFRLLVTVESG